MCWNDIKCEVQILEKDNRIITALVKDKEVDKSFVLSGIYGPTKNEEKDEFWERLQNLNSQIKVPWIIVGDFNQLYSQQGKRGGAKVTFGRLKKLNEFCLKKQI